MAQTTTPNFDPNGVRLRTPHSVCLLRSIPRATGIGEGRKTLTGMAHITFSVPRTLPAVVRTLVYDADNACLKTQGQRFQEVVTFADAADAADAVFPSFTGGGGGASIASNFSDHDSCHS